MLNLRRMMNQECTYWVKTPGTDAFGKPSFSAPVTRLVRWEDVMTQIQDKQGQDRVSKSTIYSDADWSLAGYLYLGTSLAANPLEVEGAYEIIQVSRVPDLRNLQQLYTAYL
jgi:hypothetical protein